ncbi:Small-conductance mechanosensitive channel [Paracidovorax valerianellae]|uniref:Small-conductance mechanosensitive channel n=2 Tax=Paracidovorax valerianellae TaxID=187868 RepID=A0A1G6P2N7_9BURK|nr:Small-conductance mechanosensitive channel [Paracidovorax valerianellae]
MIRFRVLVSTDPPLPPSFSRIPPGLRAWLSGLVLLACLLMGLAAVHPASAQDRAGANAPASSASATASAPRAGDPVPRSVDDLRKQLDAVPKKLDPDDDGRKRVNEVYAIGTAAEQLVAQRTEELADLDTRLAGLGPSPEKGAPADAPDVAQQRAALAKQRAIVDADLKLARLIVVDSDQRSADLVRQRRQQFKDALTARIDSPLGPTYWRALRNAWPSDTARLSMLAIEARQALERAMEPARRATFLGSLAGALLLAVLGNWVAKRVLVRVAPTRLPSGRLRRSLLAAVSVVVHVLLIGLAAQLALSGVDVGDNLGERLHGLGSTAVRLAIFSSFAIGLGHALLSRRRSSWRLPSLSDDLARRLSPYPWWIAIVASTSGLVTEINTAVGASLAAEVTTQAVTALLVALIAIACLRHLHSPPVANKDEHASGDKGAAADSAPAATPRPLWVGLLVACAGFASVATLVLVALGFVALASTLARQMVWSAIVFATAYLLYQLADDVCEAVLSSKGSFGRRLHSGMGIDASLLDQAAVLGSGVLRVVLFFYMVIGLMAPFGTGPDEVFRRGSSLNNGLQVGNFAFAPQALLTALAVIAAGFVGIRVLKRWLSDRYFPNTTLEPGMRSSIVSLLGYVGAVLVVAAALAALGISVERIAWVASALSVGIGFGLQAIVQNFISGLILLAERPVKVGDWVVLGDTEGDVRRVNVRATEIQLGDRSTVIVPNSEFITKTVRNMTLTGAPGRVLLRLPAPLDTDAQRMREVILQAFHAHEGIMEDPEPIVQLEGILNGTLTFLAIGYVSNPRNAGGVKSDLLFTILDNLRGAGLALSPPATTSLAHPTLASPTVAVPQPQGSNGPATTVV